MAGKHRKEHSDPKQRRAEKDAAKVDVKDFLKKVGIVK